MPVALDLIATTGILTLQQAAQTSVTAINESTTTVTLYKDGCDFVDEKAHFTSNCTEACQQPAAVWDSMHTLHNCLTYPAVATLLSTGDLTSKDADIALSMGFLPDINVTMVTEPIDQCMHSFCREITDSGECYAHDIHKFDPKEFVHGACGYFKASPNVDVGGVGVYVGYLMQLSILIYCYLHGRILANWARFITYALYSPWGSKRALQAGSRVQERLKNAHQQAALISGLVEFQRAQAFFGITLQAAGITSLVGSGRVFEAESYQQMHLTISLLGDVAATGVVCIAFGLYMLHACNKRSWYTTVLSFVAIIISFVAWILTRLPLRNLKDLSPEEHNLPSCGGRSPGTYCLDPQARKNTVLESIFVAIGMATIPLLAVRHWQTYHSKKSKADVSAWRLEIGQAIYATMTVWMIILLVDNGELSAMREGMQWTFAQLISVTIWAPCIVEYLYAAVRKWSLGANAELQALFADEDSDEE